MPPRLPLSVGVLFGWDHGGSVGLPGAFLGLLRHQGAVAIVHCGRGVPGGGLGGRHGGRRGGGLSSRHGSYRRCRLISAPAAGQQTQHKNG